MLITDKTVMNVTAYARLVLKSGGPGDAAVLTALEALSAAWAPSAYDAVIYASDHYDQGSGGDRYRSKVLGLQTAAGEWVRRIDSKVRDLGLIPD